MQPDLGGLESAIPPIWEVFLQKNEKKPYATHQPMVELQAAH